MSRPYSRQLDARWWGPALAYTLVCGVLWPVPVFGLLHAESSAVVAGVAFFVAGLAGISSFRQLEPLGRVLIRHLALLVVPLALLTVSLLWRANCAYWTGLGIFVVLVPPSAVFGVALAYALTGGAGRWAPGLLVAIGLVVAVGGVIADLGFHPQLFTYNHVFGGVLGPIYDEELAVRQGLFTFRGLTLLWALWLVVLGHARRGAGPQRRSMVRAAAGLSLLIGATYLLAVPLGFQQSHRSLAAALGARSDVGRFEIYYDADTLEPEVLRRIEDELLYRYHQIEAALEIEPSQTIRVYLYPDPETKGTLIGSRETSVVPVWLPVPQVHMLVDQVNRSAGHELVHVFAREFGMPVLRATPAVGLVEGIAVALEPPDGLPAPTDLVLAAQQANVSAQGLEQDPAEVALATMDPIGFWTTRAGVAYTTSGAFVRWLLDEYGSAPFREAYRTGNVERAYNQPLATLAQRWAASLAGQRPSPQAIELAKDLLTRRSLFERVCPHYVPPFVRDTRTGIDALEAGDMEAARIAFASSLQAEPKGEAALVGWARAMAADHQSVSRDSLLRVEAAVLDSLAGPRVAVALADLHRLLGNDPEADRLYEEALTRTPSYAPLASALTRIRRALSREGLHAMLQRPDDPASAANGAEGLAPVHAALLWDQAGVPDRAWAVAQRWNLDELATNPTDRAALMGLQGRLAYWAADWAVADSLASASALAYRPLAGPAAFATDWANRARWRRDLPPDSLDERLSE
ncbi:MAG: hypothetical protein AAF170_18925 [Bacteroidota bacterium]